MWACAIRSPITQAMAGKASTSTWAAGGLTLAEMNGIMNEETAPGEHTDVFIDFMMLIAWPSKRLKREMIEASEAHRSCPNGRCVNCKKHDSLWQHPVRQAGVAKILFHHNKWQYRCRSA